MKTHLNLFAMLLLTLGACAPLAAVMSPVIAVPVVSIEGPVERQLDRVLDRHDAYVSGDATLDPEMQTEWLAQSEGIRMVIDLAPAEGLPRDQMPAVLGVVLDRHDAYVVQDPALDQLALDTYMAGSASLRRLFYPQPQ